MYELNDKEFKKYTSNNLFRMACERAYRAGFSKEQMLSELAIMLLEEKEVADKKRIEEMLMSTRPRMLLNN